MVTEILTRLRIVRLPRSLSGIPERLKVIERAAKEERFPYMLRREIQFITAGERPSMAVVQESAQQKRCVRIINYTRPY